MESDRKSREPVGGAPATASQRVASEGMAFASTPLTRSSSPDQASADDVAATATHSLNPVWARVLRVVALAASDLLALWLSGAAAYLLWARPIHGQPVDMYLGLAPLVTLLLAAYLAADLYPGFGLGPVESLRRTWLVTIFGFVVLAAFPFAVMLP